MNLAAHRRRHRAQPGINLTPMLDVIFNLIFFFILTTSIREDSSQLEVNLPRSATGAVTRQAERIPQVQVRADGRLVFQGRNLTETQLSQEMSQLARSGTRQVQVAGDSTAPYGRIWEVMDLCKSAGIESALLDYQPSIGGGR